MSIQQTQSSPSLAAPLARRVSSFRVVKFDPGTVLGIGERGNAFTLFSNAAFSAVEFGDQFFDEVWLVSGNVIIEYTHRLGARLSPVPNEPRNLSTSTNDTDLVVNVNGATLLLAASAARRTATLQNLSTQKIIVSKTNPAPATANVGDAVLAILTPCAVAGDGTGGTFVIDGYAGALYGNAAAPGLVAVGAF